MKSLTQNGADLYRSDRLENKKRKKKENKSKPQNHNLVFSNRVGHSEHAYIADEIHNYKIDDGKQHHKYCKD